MVEFIYAGIRKGDGSIRAMCCDDEGAEDHTAECVADWIKRGLMVVRMSRDEYRVRLNERSQHQPPPLPAVHPIVEQVRHDASQLGPESLSSTPLGFRGEMPDLSQADQSPKWGPITGEYPPMSFDDDAKTRIVSRSEPNAHAG